MSGPGAAWDGYWFEPVAAARVWLVRAGTLVLLALDVWVTRIGPGWRYGAGGFNVAQFAWLDAIQPAPTPALYLSLLVLVGLGAIVAAATEGTSRTLLATVAVLHTWAWAMSMQDGYQHHYFLSLILAALVFLPRLTATELLDSNGDRLQLASAWAYVLIGMTTAIVYLYAAWSKLEAEWLSGRAFLQIAGDTSRIPVAPVLARLGMSEGALPWLASRGIVLAEVLCAAGCVLAPLRDRSRSRALSLFCALTLLTALAFQLGIAALDLDIGWFGWYLGLVSLVLLLPGIWVSRIVRVIRWAARMMPLQVASRSTPLARAAVVAAALGIVGRSLDLPGVFAGCAAAGAVLVVATLAGALRGAGAESTRYVNATAVAGLALWLAVSLSTAQYDFYRFGGGDARRRQDVAAALEWYGRAERYAPSAESRERIAVLRERLRSEERLTPLERPVLLPIGTQSCDERQLCNGSSCRWETVCE